MSKEEDIKFPKIQTCVLKVNIHCDGCRKKVKKILQKVDGVFQTTIDAENGRVTVSSNVDPAKLIKKLNKAGKHAELLLPKGVNITQLQKPQQDNQKSHPNKDNAKPPKGGAAAGAGKDQKGQTAQFQQLKGFKDLKFPQLKDLKLPFQKDSKSVKFALPPDAGEDCSDYDDFDDDEEDDFDDDDIDEFDSFDADFDDDFRSLKLKPGSAPPNAANGAMMMMMPDKKSAKKGGAVEIPVKGMNGNSDAKNGKKGNPGHNHAAAAAAAAAGKNAGKVVGGGPMAQDTKNPGNNGASKTNSNAPKKGGGGGGGGGVKNEIAGGAPMARNAGPNMPPAGFPAGMNAGQMGFNPSMGHVQGIPPGMAPQGYFAGGGGMPAMNPEMMAAAGGNGNPYQQQYMAAMMQQQQRMMMNGQDRGYPPPMMGYPRPPPPPAMYMAQPPPYGEPYTNYFSDENANSCLIM